MQQAHQQKNIRSSRDTRFPPVFNSMGKKNKHSFTAAFLIYRSWEINVPVFFLSVKKVFACVLMYSIFYSPKNACSQSCVIFVTFIIVNVWSFRNRSICFPSLEYSEKSNVILHILYNRSVLVLKDKQKHEKLLVLCVFYCAISASSTIVF